MDPPAAKKLAAGARKPAGLAAGARKPAAASLAAGESKHKPKAIISWFGLTEKITNSSRSQEP